MNDSYNGQNDPTVQISDNHRQLIVERVVNDGDSTTTVANDLRLKRSTVAMIVKTYRDTGRIFRSSERGKRGTKVTPDLEAFLEITMEREPGITLSRLKTKCIQELNINVAISSLYKANLKITLKRSSIILDRVNDPERRQLRREYATDFLLNHSADIRKNVFVDESGFNLHMRRNYGRSHRGTRVNFTVPTIRGRNVTLLAAISAVKIVHYKIFVGSCTSEIFRSFLAELDLIMVEQLGITDGCIFMDNARAHTANATQSTMALLTNNTKFLSPYSYMLNPIESAFGKIKTSIRRLLVGQDETLTNLIILALSEVISEDCAGWYRYIERNCILASQGHAFE